MFSWVGYLEVVTTVSLFEFLPLAVLIYSIFLRFTTNPEYKRRVEFLLFFITGACIFSSTLSYFLLVLVFHVNSFNFYGIPVPKSYLYTTYIVSTGLWFFATGIKYSKIDFKALLRGEVKQPDMKRLLTGIMISLLWIPLIMAIISVG